MTIVTAATVGSDLLRGFLQGLPAGSVYALVALGFVLTYKTSGVFNLAFGAQAYASAALYFQARTDWGWGALPSVLLAVVIVAPLLGLVLERLIFRHLRNAGALPKLVVAIGLTVAIPNLFDLLSGFRSLAGKTPVGVVPNGANIFYDVFGTYKFSRNELFAMAVGAAVTLGLGLLFRFTPIGLQMRAVVESTRMAELNGVNAERVSAFAWTLSSLFAGLAGVLIAPRFNTLAAVSFFSLMVVAIAAAAVGRLMSLPWAWAGGLGLGVLIAEANTFVPRWSESQRWLKPLKDLAPGMPFLVLFGVLVFVPSIRRAVDAGDPLAGVDPPPRTIGAAKPDPRAQRIARIVQGVLIVVIGYVVWTQADLNYMNLVTQAVVLGTIFLSITVITGMAGEISLCQGAFAATGAFTAFRMADAYGMSSIVGALIGGVVAGLLAALLSVPIRRLSGIWIAIATLAFAFFFDSVLLPLPFVGGGTTFSTTVPRPVLGPFDFADNRSFLVLALVVFIVLALAVTQLRAGTFGRTLLALRGSPVGAESIGISRARARMMAFALSGFIAGIGGALLAMQQKNVNYSNNFGPLAALFWLVLVVSLGARTVEGAAISALSFSLFDKILLQGVWIGWLTRDFGNIPRSIFGAQLFPLPNQWRLILFGLGAIQYARHPEGGLEYAKRRRSGRQAARAEKKAARGVPPGGAAPSVDVREAAEVAR